MQCGEKCAIIPSIDDGLWTLPPKNSGGGGSTVDGDQPRLQLGPMKTAPLLDKYY